MKQATRSPASEGSTPGQPTQADARSSQGGRGNAFAIEQMAGAMSSVDDGPADFQASSFASLIDHQASGEKGLFDVHLNPSTGVMDIVLRVAFDFQNGDPKLDIDGFNGADGERSRGHRKKEYKWKDADKKAWLDEYKAQVTALISSQHPLKSTRSGWEEVAIDTRVRVEEDASSPQWTIRVNKLPEDAGGMANYIQDAWSGNYDSDPFDKAAGTKRGFANLDSHSTRPQSVRWGQLAHIEYEGRKARIPSEGHDVIADQATAWEESEQILFKVTSVVDPAEHKNVRLAEKRSKKVEKQLTSKHDVPDEKIQVTNQFADAIYPTSNRTSLEVVEDEPINVGIHETMHMFGVGDEYFKDDAGNTVLKPEYDQRIKDQTGKEFEEHDTTDSIMNGGSTIHPLHYTSFLEALKKITNSGDWSL